MMDQIEASDQWNYYQAKSIKASVLDAKMSTAGAPDESDQSKLARYEKEQEQIKVGSRGQASRSKIQFSPARSFRACRGHVPNRHCRRSDLRAHEKAPFLDGESAFRCRRLHFPRLRACFNRALARHFFGLRLIRDRSHDG